MEDPFYNSDVPDHVPEHLVRDLNIYEYQWQDPFFVFRRLHEEGVPELFWTRNNGGHWIARTAAAIGEISKNFELFSSRRSFVPEIMNTDPPLLLPVQTDPPEHTAYRKAVLPLFSPSRIAAIEGRLQDVTADLVQEIRTAGTCEFMDDFARQMPVIVFLELMDLPIGDRDYLLALTKRVVKPDEGEDRSVPMAELFGYLSPIVAHRQATRGSDSISQLISAGQTAGVHDFNALLRLTTSILLSGLDSTSASLGFFAGYLAQEPEARALLAEQPDIIPAATEEIFRRFPPGTMGRVVSQDVTYRGIGLRKGDHLQWASAMYNLDESIFPDPMVVDFRRKRSSNSTFGAGIHFCTGASLARLQMNTFAKEWLSRIPEFSIRDGADIRYRTGLNIAYETLPLVFQAA